MHSIDRRRFIKTCATLPFAVALIEHSHANSGANALITTDFDISRYDRILLPREHGQLTRLRTPIFRRYPSRDHCMQMAAFFNDKEGMVVMGNDPAGSIADWKIRPGNSMTLQQHSQQSAPYTVKIPPDPEAAARVYREWSQKQFWVTQRSRAAQHLDFIAVASSSSIAAESQHITSVRNHIDGKIAVWFTQWRRHSFDQQYPEYQPKQPREFSEYLSFLRQKNILTMPYINSVLWDTKLKPFHSTGNKVAVRTQQATQQIYNEKLNTLMYACPASKTWQDTLLTARNAIVDADNQPTTGIYLDMLAAAEPLICWSSQHDHEPGDPLAWQNGLRSLIGSVSGKKMVEGCAETYLDLADYFLMHLHTDKDDAVPLWKWVYGDLIQTVGWKLENGIDQKAFNKLVNTASTFGVGAHASPWMSHEPEAALFARNILNPPQHPEVRK